jgi:hypothetical protein
MAECQREAGGVVVAAAGCGGIAAIRLLKGAPISDGGFDKALEMQTVLQAVKPFVESGRSHRLPRLAVDHQRREPARRRAQRRTRAQPPTPGRSAEAEREMQLDERSQPKTKKQSRTA